MTEQERNIQIALGTLKEYAVQFVFGTPPKYLFHFEQVVEFGDNSFWKNCAYKTVVFATDEKDALNIAREEAFQKKKWQKGLTDYKASDTRWIIDSIKKELALE